MMVVFEKGAAMRYIGHLDMMRTIQRSLRRSGLPISFSKGFNPHVRLAFAAPLSVGIVGLHELMDVPMEEEISETIFKEKMNSVLPECFRIISCRMIQDEYPSLMSLVGGGDYRIDFPKCTESEKAVRALNEFTALKEYVVDRRTKSGENPCDIMPFVQNVTLIDNGDEYSIHLTTKALAGGMLKPSLWLDALCGYSGAIEFPHLIYRQHILAVQNSRLIPMEDL